MIETDPSPRTAASRNYPPRIDGARVHASEIFQITTVNTYYQENGIARRYDQNELPPPQNATDNGERLYDTSNNPPEEVLGDDGTAVRSPGLSTGALVDVARTITGRDDIGALHTPSYDGDDDRVTQVKSEQELNDKLAEAKANGKLPMIILVNTDVEPLRKDSGNGAAGGSGGAHVITVTDYEPGPPARVNVDNQWDNGSDYQGDKKMTVHDLYKVMLSTEDAVTEVQKEVDQARAEGRVDVFKETDLLRMKKSTGKISEEDYEKELKDLICRTKDDYACRGDDVTAAERDEARTRLRDMIEEMPVERHFDLYTAMRDGGIIDDNEYQRLVKRDQGAAAGGVAAASAA